MIGNVHNKGVTYCARTSSPLPWSVMSHLGGNTFYFGEEIEYSKGACVIGVNKLRCLVCLRICAGVVDGEDTGHLEAGTLMGLQCKTYAQRKYHDEGVVKTNHNISHTQPSDRAGGRCDVTNSIGG